MTQIAFTNKELVKFLKWFCDSDFYETEIGGQFKNIKQSDVIYTFEDIVSHYYSDPQKGEKDLLKNIPDGENDWTVGSDTFTRQEVFRILFTQRAMISNDIKCLRFHSSFPDLKLYNSKDIYDIINSPRVPEI